MLGYAKPPPNLQKLLRNQIFEEYANGGLELLQNELRGAVDYTERIVLMLSYERNHQGGRERI
jgi:dnd system-associated protein 4